MRKASFSVEKVSSNTDAHNTREHSPKYLIGCEKGKENEYIKYYEYNNFQELAEARYLEVNKQKMQTSQKEALFEEAVISLEEHHTKDDVVKLFESLNKKYTGHTLINLAIHRDEGHFVKDGIEYYPTMHIIQKNDGNWYILDENDTEILEALKDKDFKPKAEDFKVKVNINDFEKVYNYHAHAVFSRFDLETGKSARFQKGTMSERYKFVAEQMQMNYAPESKDRFVKKSIGQHKGDLSAVRNAKLVLKKELEQVHQQEKTILKKENSSLKGQNTKNKNEKHKLKEELEALKEETKQLRADLQVEKAEKEAYQQLDYLNKQLQEQLKTGRKSFEEAKREVEDLREKLIKNEEDLKEFEDIKKENEYLKSSIEIKEIDILELKNAQTSLKKELQEVNSQCEVLNFDKKELKENLKTVLAQKDKFLVNLQEIGKEIGKEIPIKEIKEIPEAVKTVLNQNKALQEQKIVLEGKVTTLEQKTSPEPNIVPQKEISEELQTIITEEFMKKEILESRMGKTTSVIIVKDSDSFLKRIQKLTSQGVQSVANSVNSLKKEINEWKEKYNNLMEVLKSKDQKIADLEEKLQTISTKQQNQTQTKDHLEGFVEKFEANQGEKSDSSILKESKEVQEEEIKGKIRRKR